MFKRIGLLLITNVLIMVTITTIINIFGLQPFIAGKGINYLSLIIFCGIWGFAGAFISLFLSKTMAKMMMGVRLIDDSVRDQRLLWVQQVTNRLSDAAGLPKRPEVGYYESPDMNAFATGPSRSNSLVAVSTGLLDKMTDAEIEGVLAHEVAHIANGDMVTMTLLQGIVNSFGMFLARVIGYAVSQFVDEEKAPIVQMVSTIVLDILFSILGMFVVAYYSRQREFRADAGSASIGGKPKMIAALQRLQLEMSKMTENEDRPKSPVASLQISNKTNSLFALLSTHPSLEERIARLNSAA
jgi:heat shock protein HtpX